MKEQEITKMELLLTLNDKIIVQRFYNVKGYNPNSKNSLELYEFLSEVKEDLALDLKTKTVIYKLQNHQKRNQPLSNWISFLFLAFWT